MTAANERTPRLLSPPGAAHAGGGIAMNIAAWLAALALVALPLVAVMNGWFASDRWPFRQLKIDAEFRHVNADQVRAAAAPQLARGFFAVDLGAVRARPRVDAAFGRHTERVGLRVGGDEQHRGKVDDGKRVHELGVRLGHEAVVGADRRAQKQWLLSVQKQLQARQEASAIVVKAFLARLLRHDVATRIEDAKGVAVFEHAQWRDRTFRIRDDLKPLIERFNCRI